MVHPCTLTYIGTATVLIEIGGLKILTDPVFDDPGSEYKIGKSGLVTYGSQTAPALTPEEIGSINAVLLSHDQHYDNLDRRGYKLLRQVPHTLTTAAGGARLGRKVGDKAVGLNSWDTFILPTPAGFDITVTATPARHGPIFSEWFAGPVTGFILEWPGQTHGALYITGDTRLFKGIKDIADRFTISVCLLHVGSARFWATGPIRYSMNGREAARAISLLKPRCTIPIHYDGWTHFQEEKADVEQAFQRRNLNTELLWLKRGQKTAVEI